MISFSLLIFSNIFFWNNHAQNNAHLNIIILFIIHQTVIGNEYVLFQPLNLFKQLVLGQVADFARRFAILKINKNVIILLLTCSEFRNVSFIF